MLVLFVMGSKQPSGWVFPVGQKLSLLTSFELKRLDNSVQREVAKYSLLNPLVQDWTNLLNILNKGQEMV